MATMHPTTKAIISGLRGVRQNQEHDPLGTSERVRHAVELNGLSPRDREVLIETAEKGWDLGLRTLGDHRVELSARLESDLINIGMVVTAYFDRHRSMEWQFFWSLYPIGSMPVLTVDLYANGDAPSFEEAVRLAKNTAFRRLGS